jgi:hypothetical protein
MTQLKKCKVVMLPTEKASGIYLDTYGTLHNLNYKRGVDTSGTPQHLYILSDDEIKEDDWYYNRYGHIHQFKGNDTFDMIYGGKKIIATTDESLMYNYESYSVNGKAQYPQPSQSFIEKYVEEYNKGNMITDVLVEYEEKGHWNNLHSTGKKDKPYFQYTHDELKVNPKDNTITIKKVKDSFTIAEITAAINKYIGSAEGDIEYNALCGFRDSLDENL